MEEALSCGCRVDNFEEGLRSFSARNTKKHLNSFLKKKVWHEEDY
jgi:hypothetical protein